MAGPDNEIINQEVEYMENLTEGQLADYSAAQAIYEPDYDDFET